MSAAFSALVDTPVAAAIIKAVCLPPGPRVHELSSLMHAGPRAMTAS